MGQVFKIASSKDWHGAIRIAAYDHRRARYCRDRSVSASWHSLLQTELDRKAAGFPVTPKAESDLPRRLLEQFGLLPEVLKKRRGTIAENIDDYLAELRTAGRDPKYIQIAGLYLKGVSKACNWRRIDDINREDFARHVSKRREGASLRTIKNVRAAMIAFCRWASAAGRLGGNPIDSVPIPDCRADRRRRRRALTPEEVQRVLSKAKRRELVYRLALGTGLRLKELRLLEWRDVILGDGRPRLELRSEATKNRRGGTLPLPHLLADRLRAIRGEGRTKVFKSVPLRKTFNKDMLAAGIKTHDDDRTLLVGFHSLRVTFATELERAGVSPRTIAELMRHSDYKLTATVYTDARILDTFDLLPKT